MTPERRAELRAFVAAHPDSVPVVPAHELTGLLDALDEAEAMLREAEDALLEAQNERDAAKDRLNALEPSPVPRKFV